MVQPTRIKYSLLAKQVGTRKFDFRQRRDLHRCLLRKNCVWKFLIYKNTYVCMYVLMCVHILHKSLLLLPSTTFCSPTICPPIANTQTNVYHAHGYLCRHSAHCWPIYLGQCVASFAFLYVFIASEHTACRKKSRSMQVADKPVHATCNKYIYVHVS